MNLKLNCPHCYNLLEVDPGWAGHQLECPLCHNNFTVPSAPLASSAALPPPLPTQEAPKLWNPNAAASWSVLLSPAFGPYLHHLNWRALGEHDKAAGAFWWFVVGLLITLGLMVGVHLQPNLQGLAYVVCLVFMVVWLYASGKKQVTYIKDRFGENYQRRSWFPPILAVIGMFLLVVVAMEFGTGGLREKMVTQSSVNIVNDLLTRSGVSSNIRCLRVQLDGNAGPNDYFATAFFTTGDSAPARVQVHGDVVMVNLEPTTIVGLRMHEALNSLANPGQAGQPQGQPPASLPAITPAQ